MIAIGRPVLLEASGLIAHGTTSGGEGSNRPDRPDLHDMGGKRARVAIEDVNARAALWLPVNRAVCGGGDTNHGSYAVRRRLLQDYNRAARRSEVVDPKRRATVGAWDGSEDAARARRVVSEGEDVVRRPEGRVDVRAHIEPLARRRRGRRGRNRAAS